MNYFKNILVILLFLLTRILCSQEIVVEFSPDIHIDSLFCFNKEKVLTSFNSNGFVSYFNKGKLGFIKGNEIDLNIKENSYKINKANCELILLESKNRKEVFLTLGNRKYSLDNKLVLGEKYNAFINNKNDSIVTYDLNNYKVSILLFKDQITTLTFIFKDSTSVEFYLVNNKKSKTIDEIVYAKNNNCYSVVFGQKAISNAVHSKYFNQNFTVSLFFRKNFKIKEIMLNKEGNNSTIQLPFWAYFNKKGKLKKGSAFGAFNICS